MGFLFFIGTQGEGPGQGIHAARLDPATGALTDLGCVAEEERPTFTLPDLARPLLFAVSEVGNRDDRHGAIMSYRITDRAGKLAPIGRRRTGGGPTHLDQSRSGAMLYCANFGGPQAVAMPVSPEGDLSPISAVQVTQGSGPHKRQSVPHPHGVTIDPEGRFLLVPDMGADRIFVYRITGTGLTPASPPHAILPAGSGPRFVLFGQDGRFAYMIAELSAEIFQFSWQDGCLTLCDSVAMDAPDSDHDRGAAAFGLSTDGRFLYASNRSLNLMQAYRIDPVTGTLTQIQRIHSGGQRPWALALSPCGTWMVVANQSSDSIAVFRVDPNTGLLAATDHRLAVSKPTSAAFVATAVLDGLT
jgi:6-phosphogluconolactonase